jgi:thioester reductase-like protein
MKISLVRRSDYLALMSGNPSRLRLGFSEDLQQVLSRLPRSEGPARKSVLLLGANGFIGMHLLHELLTDERVTQVYALVRRKGSASGLKRITTRMSQFGMSLPHQDKLEVIEGAFTEPDMGLAASEYRRLCTQVDSVINAAGSTNHTYRYSYYRKETLMSLLRLLEYSLTDRLKSLHYIGSVGCEVFRQRRDFFRLGFFHCGYSRMKWVAKHIVQEAWSRGIPAHVYLPSFVLGSEHTSYKDPGMNYSFWQMIWYANTLGMMWDCKDTPIPIVPGDVLARSVIDNAFSASPRNVVYPALQVTSQELADRFGWAHVPFEEFRAAVKKRFSLRLGEVKWKQPLSSMLELSRHMLFTRSLFPRYLPEVIGNISTASAPELVPGIEPGASRLMPIDIVTNCARKNYLLSRALPRGS